MDITQQILDDHHRQRKMFAELDDVARDDRERLSALWDRLATFLEVHAEAEEELFYPHLLSVGAGASDAENATEETKDAISDHNKIRQAVAESRQHEIGTDAWWQAFVDTRKANSDHMAEEERQALADFRRHTDAATRSVLGAEFAAFEASHVEGVSADDHDPERYVAEKQ